MKRADEIRVFFTKISKLLWVWATRWERRFKTNAVHPCFNLWVYGCFLHWTLVEYIPMTVKWTNCVCVLLNLQYMCRWYRMIIWHVNFTTDVWQNVSMCSSQFPDRGMSYADFFHHQSSFPPPNCITTTNLLFDLFFMMQQWQTLCDNNWSRWLLLLLRNFKNMMRQ